MNAAAQKAARERLDSLSPGPWCSTYVYTQIRHVDRNCQLECTVHPDGQNCLSFGRYDGDTIAVLPTDLRAALDALERVRALADKDYGCLSGNGIDPAVCALTHITVRALREAIDGPPGGQKDGGEG